MPKRKKHIRLPNAWGCVRYIGDKRSLPYAVHPPATERDQNGHYIRPKAICYVPDWYTGFGVLSAYHAGTYTPGMEVTISREVEKSAVDLDAFCLRVLKDNRMVMQSSAPAFESVYNQFMDWKFGENAPRKLSVSARDAYHQGWKYLQVYADKPIDAITVDQLQSVVDACDKKKATRENIVLTAGQIFKYGIAHDICEKNPAQHVVVPDGREDEHGVPFSDRELKILWKHIDDPTDEYMAEMILIMCHAGYRVDAWRKIKIDLDEKTFFGGNKTRSGKDVLTPIHHDALPLVERRLKRYDTLIVIPIERFRKRFKAYGKSIGLDEHTPHDTKHTFSMLCEKFGVRENDRKRLLGHVIGNISSDVYGHRRVEELRTEIEKIKTRVSDT